jgi:hypothetical protein
MERFSALCRSAAYKNDPSMSIETGCRCPTGVEDRIKVSVDRPLPTIIRERRNRLVLGRPDPMITNKNIESLKLFITPLEQSFHFLWICKVSPLGPSLHPKLLAL